MSAREYVAHFSSTDGVLFLLSFRDQNAIGVYSGAMSPQSAYRAPMASASATMGAE
jgi:hypothetical protein